MDRICLICLILLTAGCSGSPVDRKERKEQIEAEISNLKAELKSQEKNALNADVQSQAFMREDYGQFAKELERAEASEDKVKEIEARVEELEIEKKQLEQNTH